MSLLSTWWDLSLFIITCWELYSHFGIAFCLLSIRSPICWHRWVLIDDDEVLCLLFFNDNENDGDEADLGHVQHDHWQLTNKFIISYQFTVSTWSTVNIFISLEGRRIKHIIIISGIAHCSFISHIQYISSQAHHISLLLD